MTHTHFDHVCGIPFFDPFYNPDNTFRVWAGHLLPDMTLEQVLIGMMMAPLFPVPLKIFAANMSYHDFFRRPDRRRQTGNFGENG